MKNIRYPETHISLFDLLMILKANFKLLLVAAIIGGVFSIARYHFYVYEYEAISTLRLSQFAFIAGNSKADPMAQSSLGVIDPKEIIALAVNPNSYGGDLIKKCELADGDAIVSSLSLTFFQNSNNILELRFKNPRPEVAIRCSEAILSFLNNYQVLEIAKVYDEPKFNSAEVRRAIEALNGKFSTETTGGKTELLTDLIMIDLLRDKQNQLTINKIRFGAEISKPYINNNKIGRGIYNFFFEGFFAGLILCLLFVFGKFAFSNFEKQS